MFNPNLKLNEIFVSNTLRNMTTSKHGPMPHKGNTFYVWYDNYTGKHSLAEEIMTKGNKWSVGGPSINSYIDLTEETKAPSRHIQYGPNSNSSSFTVRFVEREDGTIRITASGWGSSVTELYDGPTKYFLYYLMDHQKRGE